MQIEHIASDIANLQRLNTRTTSKPATNHEVAHPWINDAEYKNLQSLKSKLKRRKATDRTNEENRQLRQVNMQIGARYAVLKREYYERMIQSLYRDPRKFFKAMKSHTTDRSSLPPQMSYGNSHFFGNDRFQPLITHLQSCFSVPQIYFSTEGAQFEREIGQIYAQFKSKRGPRYGTRMLIILRLRKCISASRK